MNTDIVLNYGGEILAGIFFLFCVGAVALSLYAQSTVKS